MEEDSKTSARRILLGKQLHTHCTKCTMTNIRSIVHLDTLTSIVWTETIMIASLSKKLILFIESKSV